MGWNRRKERQDTKDMFEGVRLYTATAIIANMALEGHPDEAIASALGITVEEVLDVYKAGEAFELMIRKKHV